jgi:hypothetical protein
MNNYAKTILFFGRHQTRIIFYVEKVKNFENIRNWKNHIVEREKTKILAISFNSVDKDFQGVS